ncbi:MAG TPA: transcriptional repressor [Anaerolineales bacterium]|nr:transcriptional repressor [Anaerolineae bacterium]HIQ02345.1 transcriptional repressor [Anaerolineales bacterium]
MTEIKERSERVARRLRMEGYRLTPQRMAILQAVLESPSHLTAEEIYRQVSADFPMLSLATVYKTLHMLKGLGEVMELTVDGRSHYDGDAPPHPHLICVRCHTIIDLPLEMAVTVPEEALAERGFRALWHQVEVHGLCRQCQEETSRA